MKIVDCFPFFNELDLLEIRLNELSNTVDVFVLTESPYTFTGIKKPLHFEENRERFKDFNIIHTVYEPKGKYHPMVYEVHQKQYNLDCAFEIMKAGDILAHGDVDEIPRASIIKEAIKDDWRSARLIMPLFYYYMNCRNTAKKNFKNTRLVRYTDRFKYKRSQKFEIDKEYHDAGWHFSFLGDVQEKLESWGHAPEYNKFPFNTSEHIQRCKDQGTDLVMRGGKRRLNFEFINDNFSYLPQHVLNNFNKFKRYFKNEEG